MRFKTPLNGGVGVGGDVKELIGFFINHVFVGVFQYDFGPPKHALELRDYEEEEKITLHLSKRLLKKSYFWTTSLMFLQNE